MIAKEAGRELVAEGVVIMLTIKIHELVSRDYYDGITMSSLLHLSVPWYVDALVDDKEIAQEAKSFYQGALDDMSKAKQKGK